PPPPAPDAGGDDPALLRDQVRTVIAAMQRTTPDQLTADADGDISIRAGTAMVFVKVRDDPPLVDVFSPVLTGIEPSEPLYGRLSELTNRMPVGRLYFTNDTVWASVPVFGRSFQPAHLVLAVQVMTGLADELDDRLHGEFGGRRFFGEDDHPPRHSESPGTGMYL
ncbi:MAG: T3SS (YopN, CesT) and YbjN peptide-binding chaperone 1, partial [Natronosporangium sp.]